jgi:hypothetical protein
MIIMLLKAYKIFRLHGQQVYSGQVNLNNFFTIITSYNVIKYSVNKITIFKYFLFSLLKISFSAVYSLAYQQEYKLASSGFHHFPSHITLLTFI